MSIKSVHERHQARRSSYRGTTMTHTREWIVTCDDPTDGTAIAVTGVPAPGSRHPRDLTAILNGLECQPQQESDLHFIVQGEYSTTTWLQPVVSPLDLPPEISYGSAEGQEPYFLDRTSSKPKPVVNSAGDSFESFLERETGELTITITLNEATFDVVAMDGFKHTTNASPVTVDGTTYATNTLKLSAPTATKVTEKLQQDGASEGTIVYYKVVYVLKARKEAWDDHPLDIGCNEFVPDPDDANKPGKLKPIVSAGNTPVTKPWPLNGSGLKKTNPTDQAATLTFKPYSLADWSSLKFAKPETWASATY